MNDEIGNCLNCGRTSSQVPLIRLSYAGQTLWICPRCLPVLIHRPEQLPAVRGEWIAGADRPADHE